MQCRISIPERTRYEFFDDQEDDWFANDCKGSPDNYDGAGNFVPNDMGAPYNPNRPKLTRTQKRNARRKRAAALTAKDQQKTKGEL